MAAVASSSTKSSSSVISSLVAVLILIARSRWLTAHCWWLSLAQPLLHEIEEIHGAPGGGAAPRRDGDQCAILHGEGEIERRSTAAVQTVPASSGRAGRGGGGRGGRVGGSSVSNALRTQTNKAKKTKRATDADACDDMRRA